MRERKRKKRERDREGESEREREREKENGPHIPGSLVLTLCFHLVIFQGSLGGPPKVLDILMHLSSFTYTQPL